MLPSIPGVGFSVTTCQPTWEYRRVAAAFAELMRAWATGGTAHGSDWGSVISPRFHQGRDVAADEVVGLGVADRPLQREPGDLQGPGGIAIRQFAESGPDITRAQVAQRPGAYRVKQRPSRPS
jgi:hypothetical protein